MPRTAVAHTPASVVDRIMPRPRTAEQHIRAEYISSFTPGTFTDEQKRVVRARAKLLRGEPGPVGSWGGFAQKAIGLVPDETLVNARNWFALRADRIAHDMTQRRDYHSLTAQVEAIEIVLRDRAITEATEHLASMRELHHEARALEGPMQIAYAWSKVEDALEMVRAAQAEASVA